LTISSSEVQRGADPDFAVCIGSKVFSDRASLRVDGCKMLRFLIVCLLPLLVVANDWSYDEASANGPADWYHTYPTCGGHSQSPIDIQTHGLQREGYLKSFDFINYDTVSSKLFTLTNNGHSYQVTMPDNTVRIQGGGLSDHYALEQFHFHWGKDDSEGSEHLVNGRAHPLELHLVHYDITKYSSVSAATADPQGVAVLAVFVDVSESASDLSVELGGLTTQFSQVSAEEGETTTTAAFAIDSLLPRNKEYYRYHGSLTTPACNEAVIWTVFTNPIYITQAQMDAFRTLHTDGGALLLENFRPTQPLYTRTVSLSAK
jgi:carbonic anhydrase